MQKIKTQGTNMHFVTEIICIFYKCGCRNKISCCKCNVM